MHMPTHIYNTQTIPTPSPQTQNYLVHKYMKIKTKDVHP